MLRDALAQRSPDTSFVLNRGVPLAHFQGVGPFDLAAFDGEGRPGVLAEVKWSTALPRDKIYEAAWDAVKLALAVEEHGVREAWLITAASAAAWERSECADLFTDGAVDVLELWTRKLEPRGPNGGETVGRDLEEGGRGNLFTHTPRTLRVGRVSSTEIQAVDGNWLLRAASVTPHGPLVRFSPDPPFPAKINQQWLEQHVPDMAPQIYAALLGRLRAKRWTEAEIASRVAPLRSSDAMPLLPREVRWKSRGYQR